MANDDLLICSKSELKTRLAGYSREERSRIYKARWRARNPGVTEAASAEWAKANPQKRKAYRDKYAEEVRISGDIPYHTKWNRANRSNALLSAARYRAAKRGLAFNLDITDTTIPDVCPVFQFPLITDPSFGRSDASPSLDRIDNKLGYIKGNVIVVSWLANRLKNDATPEQLRIVADFYEAQA